jgi:hypothetical protein
MAKSTTNQVVLFVEGETEKEFFEALLKFYRENSSTEIKSCKIINVKGIGRFESKVAPKMKYEIIPKFPEADLCLEEQGGKKKLFDKEGDIDLFGL